MKKLLLILLMVPIISIAQCDRYNNETNVSILAGWKSAEIGILHNGLLSYGLALSVVDSKQVEKRAKKDFYTHNIKTSVVPAAFALIGGNFDEITIIGKLGTSYVDQYVNNINDSQKYYFAVGAEIDYKIENNISIRFSYDNVSSAMIGISFTIN